MAAAASAYEFAEAGCFREAADAIDRHGGVTKNLRVLRARLEIDVGNPLQAKSAADVLLRENLTQSERSTCWEIVGRVELNGGRIELGLKAMHRAFSAATQCADPKISARLIASYCDSLLHFVGIEPAAAEVPRLRQAAIATGDPFCLIAFHSIVAELKAKKGSISEAKHSAETAHGLLQQWPHVWQQGRLAVARSGIHILESDYDRALSAATEALDCAEKTGSRRLRIPALGNFAHIKLAQGELEDATKAVNHFLSLVQKGGNSEIAGLDTLLQIALAKRDLELSGRLAQQVYETSAGLEGGVSYHGLWHILTRVKWLYQVGEIEAGVSLAMETIPLAQRMSDRNLLIRMKLIAAEGLGRTRRQLEGAALLSEAIGPNARAPLEIMAEAMRVTGRITAQVDSPASQDHYRRALQVFDTVGNITARDDVLRDSNESLGSGTHLIPEAHPEGSFARDESTVRLPVASAIERIAGLMQFAVLPPLIARELLTLVADTGAISQATLTVTDKYGQRKTRATFPNSGSTSAIDANPGAVRIALGSHDGCLHEIVALPLPSASARATVLSIEHLVEAAFAVASFRQLQREQAAGWSDQTPEQQLGLICASDRMIELVKTIRRVADSNVTVLLTGETGVGKELFARALHQASSRSEKTFLPFNCSTVPRDMFDSQLFGHRRGSFTGAHEDSAGVIRAAAGGTLFLDEIGEMSLDVQPKLLRFLESGEVQPLGDPKPKFVDVRVVAATNANLDQLVGDGRFREDLFYRLNVIRINIPPLRERREEIPAMVEHFLEKFGRELQKPMLRIADETLEYLVLYRWPGNVRQLANELRRMVAMAEPGSVLMPAHLSDEIASSRRTVPASAPQLRQSTEVVTRIDQPLSAAVEHIERAAIQRAIKLADGRLDDAAKMLGLSRKGLYLKRQRLNLE